MINFNIFATNLVAHELLHLLVALIIAGFVVRRYHSWKLAGVILAVTFLIDVDHLSEGFLIHGLNPQSWLSSPFSWNYFMATGKMTIFFHSWETLPLILFLGKKFNHWPLVVSVVLAAAGHYLVDQIVYTSAHGMSIFKYFFLYRAFQRFDF